jgi:hypothetical protein
MRSCWYGRQCDDGGVLGVDWERARARSDLRVGKMIFLEIGLAWCRTMALVSLEFVTRDYVQRGGHLYSKLSFFSLSRRRIFFGS